MPLSALNEAIVVELQSKGAPALGLGAQGGGVAEHLGQGGGAGDEAHHAFGHELLHLAFAGGKVTHNLAGEFLRGDDLHLHDGLQQLGLALVETLFQSGHGRDPEGHLRGLTFPDGGVGQSHGDVHRRVPVNRPAFQSFGDRLGDQGHKALGRMSFRQQGDKGPQLCCFVRGSGATTLGRGGRIAEIVIGTTRQCSVMRQPSLLIQTTRTS